MRKILAIAATSIAVLAATTTAPVTAQAGDRGGAIAAGIISGIAAGAILSAFGPHPAESAGYYGPSYGPVYSAPTCYWAPGRPYWNGWRWVPSRVQVCD